MKSFVQTTTAFVALGLLAVSAASVSAQQIFRSVGPDGRVTFSDQAPASGAQTSVAGSGAAAPSQPALPFELRQSVTRFPVVLYTSIGCGPCGNGRAMLTARGIPFSERLVGSSDDIDALQRISGETGVPFLTIGSQQLKGYSETEWTQFLNAAGYPKTSVLPPTYRNPPPTPLVSRTDAAAATAPAEARPQTPAPSSGPAPSNPAGIRF